ncbi:galactokinase [Emticicia oligotrophica DSM 17448]|uniref:Galactokinase n=1 Tax=Emticicia oligotrophica (strain DSM 17448 / CIP 109782 / MTCC 6937 / GPTSA100-15) TaxID=929562 RepID=A0ABN4AIQ5_EMTOG|nr:galactokinase [Emticicia oligotrophica]AFK01890.1 galactokinase [Emticicia oligotrophica DSM 17448]
MLDNILTKKFKDYFGENPHLLVRAPGRINLIGEHTDYNKGFVLPAAIDKAIYYAIAPRNDNTCVAYAFDLDDSFTFSIDNLVKSEKGWANFLIGVVAEIINTGVEIKQGFNVIFGGDVPLGAGLSSSAAVESGMGFALNSIFDLGLSKLDLALIAQKAEHNYAGVKCGIMDMFASIHGKENSVIKLDCQDLSFEYFPFAFPDYSIVLCNTGVKHNLGDSEYNQRRDECEEGVRILQRAFPQIESLRDVSFQMLRSQADKLPPVVYKRCKYVVEEIERVTNACQALEKADLATFGQKMYETHEGLSNEYEVSCEELDFLVEQTHHLDTVIGARMMGGGFGGCTINLVKANKTTEFIEQMSSAYNKQFSTPLQCYLVQISNGVELLTEEYSMS